MEQVLTGTVQGNTIVLDSLPAIANGEQVEVVLRAVAAKGVWGEGIRDSAGGWAGYPELDAIMESIHAQRALERGSANGP
ncbi:MAG TPA: hypothetical protein VFV87_09745 [Pirellulaceae bacterium]|nr:hypothetical protein [Pirellulaceae bacterium]